MWQAAAGAGFSGGRVLEPGCGSGTFLATAPAGLDLKPVGVELDPVTAQIAAALHPAAVIRAESFADTRFPDGWFDLTIGNVPFGDYTLFDPIYNRAGLSIHNHFLAKSLRLTRPGGYVIALTSRFTLDARSTAARTELAELGDLVGAVRLPEGAMRRVAGTGVAMDLLVLRRREPGAHPAGPAWQAVEQVETGSGPVEINEVFAAHPGWVLGTLAAGRGQYGQDDVEVRPQSGRPLPAQLQAALSQIGASAGPAGLRWTPRPAPEAGRDGTDPQVVEGVVRGPHHVEGSLLATPEGGFAAVRGGLLIAHTPPASQAGELRLLIDLRETYFELVDGQVSGHGGDDGDAGWRGAQQRLNTLYDRYHATYGPVSRYTETPTGRLSTGGEPIWARRFPRMGGFRDDPGLPVVRALEHFDDETKTATKAALFTRRVLAPRQVATTAQSPQDALALCLDQRGRVELDTVGRLLGCGRSQARQRLGDLVYDDPAGGPVCTAAQYLSGNVRVRLEAARAAAATDPRWAPNVAALEAVQPTDLLPGEIEASLGAPWIPAPDVRAFCAQVLAADVTVEYAAATGEWTARLESGYAATVALSSQWGTARVGGVRLLEATANQRTVTVTDEHPDGGRVVNLPETLAAREKQEALADRFRSWVWEDPARAGRLAADYNQRFNAVVLPAYDGSHLTLPGLAEGFRPHDHQRDAVWRMLSEPTVLLAHDVGAGKTASMVMGGFELKRLGMVNKPAYVVPNHMLEQFSSEYLQLYPAAKILIASKEDVSPDRRREFVARCAGDDWDAVILTHASFERIGVSAATQRQFLDTQIGRLRESIDASNASGKGVSVKALQKALARAEERHKALLGDDRRDAGGVTFEACGIDYVLVDEAQAFKNLAISSHIQAVSSEGSKRAEDMAMKIDWLRSAHSDRVATFATATPISNSVAEMFKMQRYLQPEALTVAGVEHFDGWAANFGRTVTTLELAPDARTYRMNTRFARFSNVPDLLRMFRTVADVRSAAQLDLPVPAIAGGRPQTVVVPACDGLRDYVTALVDRAEGVRNRRVTPQEDNMLKVSGDGRRAALDLRLVGLPPDPAGGKIAALADRVAAIHALSEDRTYLDPDGSRAPRPGGLQLVFCDQGTPQPDGRWTVYDQIRTELTARGVPPEAIRFIHEARNDAEKGRLFAAARAGSVAVLIGSTEKMGVGTNVQARAVALHHLDCPWKPAELHQRDGRIIRQGNQNPDVQILRYVTEGSFDVYSWQTVERKAAFIDQVMAGTVTERSVDDVGEDALSYAEVKALATGNPLIMEAAGLTSEVTKLERLQAAHRRDQAQLARTAAANGQQAERQEHRAALFAAAAARAVPTAGDRFTMLIDGRRYAKRADAAAALRDAVSEAGRAAAGSIAGSGPVEVPIGQLAGFPVLATTVADHGQSTVALSLHGIPGYTPSLTRDELATAAPLGMITRLENLAGDLPARGADAEHESRFVMCVCASAVGSRWSSIMRARSP